LSFGNGMVMLESATGVSTDELTGGGGKQYEWSCVTASWSSLIVYLLMLVDDITTVDRLVGGMRVFLILDKHSPQIRYEFSVFELSRCW